MNETTFHAGVSRRIKSADGHIDYSINISGIPFNASEDFIRRAAQNAEIALAIIGDEIENRIRGGAKVKLNPDAFAPVASAPNKVYNPLEYQVPEKYRATQTITPSEGGEIDPFVNVPYDHEIRTSATVFGIEIQMPHVSWCHEGITKVNVDGGGGGQLKALNTALSNDGFKGDARHIACLAILSAFGEIHGDTPRDYLNSLNDLTKAEAHVVLSFFQLATPDALKSLSLAVQVMA